MDGSSAVMTPAVQHAFDLNVGSTLFGYSVACIFYGCSTVQTFIYYRVSPRDSRWMKFSIFGIWLLDSLHTAFLAACIYIIVVSDAGDLTKMENATWALSDAIYVTCVIELAVRALFITRIWKLSKGSRVLVGALAILSLGVCASSLVWGVHVKTSGDFMQFKRTNIPIDVTFSAGLFTDMVMIGSQCFLLWANRTGFTSSDSIVRRLVVYILNTGMLICVITGAILITHLASPGSMIFIAVYLALPKTFFNSLLASLNIRQLAFSALDSPPRDNRGANLAAGKDVKEDFSSDLAVRIETTTIHKIDECYVIPTPKCGRRWKPDNTARMPEEQGPDAHSPEDAESSNGTEEAWRPSSTLWHSQNVIETHPV